MGRSVHILIAARKESENIWVGSGLELTQDNHWQYHHQLKS
jgi:hypothetical protein